MRIWFLVNKIMSFNKSRFFFPHQQQLMAIFLSCVCTNRTFFTVIGWVIAQITVSIVSSNRPHIRHICTEGGRWIYSSNTHANLVHCISSRTEACWKVVFYSLEYNAKHDLHSCKYQYSGIYKPSRLMMTFNYFQMFFSPTCHFDVVSFI